MEVFDVCLHWGSFAADLESQWIENRREFKGESSARTHLYPFPETHKEAFVYLRWGSNPWTMNWTLRTQWTWVKAVSVARYWKTYRKSELNVGSVFQPKFLSTESIKPFDREVKWFWGQPIDGCFKSKWDDLVNKILNSKYGATPRIFEVRACN